MIQRSLELLSDFSCDGCNLEITSQKGFYCCRKCIGVELCRECMMQYRTGVVSVPLCSGHEFFDARTSEKIAAGVRVSRAEIDLCIAKLLEQYEIE